MCCKKQKDNSAILSSRSDILTFDNVKNNTIRKLQESRVAFLVHPQIISMDPAIILLGPVNDVALIGESCVLDFNINLFQKLEKITFVNSHDTWSFQCNT